MGSGLMAVFFGVTSPLAYFGLKNLYNDGAYRPSIEIAANTALYGGLALSALSLLGALLGDSERLDDSTAQQVQEIDAKIDALMDEDLTL